MVLVFKYLVATEAVGKSWVREGDAFADEKRGKQEKAETIKLFWSHDDRLNRRFGREWEVESYGGWWEVEAGHNEWLTSPRCPDPPSSTPTPRWCLIGHPADEPGLCTEDQQASPRCPDPPSSTPTPTSRWCLIPVTLLMSRTWPGLCTEDKLTVPSKPSAGWMPYSH